MFLNKRHFYANGFSISSLALLRRHLFWLPILSLITIIFVFLLGPSIILSRTSAAGEPEAPVPVGLPTLSLSISDGANDISLDIAPINPNGTFRTSDTTNNNIEVSTTNYTGYTLGITASVDGDNALSYTPTGGTTSTIPSITSSVSASDYADDAYAENNHLNNTWGYRPSTLYDSINDTNVSNTDYMPAPASTIDQVAIAKTDSATTPSVPDGYNIAIGARVDSNTVPGNYANTFVITATTNLVPYSITYNQNATDTVMSMPNPNPQTGNADTTTNTVALASAPTRSGYTFRGWCTVQVADDAACTGTEYAAGANYDIDYTTGNNTFTLYVRWSQPTIYDEVIAEWTTGGSRVQTNDTDENTGIQATITTANSGVFKYNSATDAFGADSDNTKPDGAKADIYYFRGILDSNLSGTSDDSSYGSMGDGVTWPNYVRLGDTCWRIVRTTASGGVKMVYNGLYSTGTTANSCANATDNAQITTSPFNNGSATVSGKSYTGLQYQNIHAVGYTYSSLAASTTTAKTVSTIFGATGNDTTTNTNP